MTGIITIVIFIVTLVFTIIERRKLPKGETSQDPLTQSQKILVWVLCIFNPIIAGAVMYYGWKKRWPVKAKTTNHISLVVFLIQFVLFAIWFFVVEPKREGITINNPPQFNQVENEVTIENKQINSGANIVNDQVSTNLPKDTPAKISDCMFTQSDSRDLTISGQPLKETLHFFHCSNGFDAMVDILTGETGGIASAKLQLNERMITMSNNGQLENYKPYKPMIYNLQLEFTWIHGNTIYIVKPVPKPRQSIGVQDVDYLHAIIDYFVDRYPPTEALDIQ